jgi:fatty-acid desaturase
MIEWVRDHRVHHKYTDTNADPHNSKRGFFFCHIGWLMCQKHPHVKKFGSRIDMSDVESDPVLQFQRKYDRLVEILLLNRLTQTNTPQILHTGRTAPQLCAPRGAFCCLWRVMVRRMEWKYLPIHGWAAFGLVH